MDEPPKPQEDPQKDDINALSDNKVDVEIEPDVKSNDVVVQICSCSLIFNCFSSSNNRCMNVNIVACIPLYAITLFTIVAPIFLDSKRLRTLLSFTR